MQIIKAKVENSDQNNRITNQNKIRKYNNGWLTILNLSTGAERERWEKDTACRR